VVADSCVAHVTAEDLERVVHERDPATHGMAERIADCHRWLSSGGGHPALRTDARGFRPAADAFLAGVRF